MKKMKEPWTTHILTLFPEMFPGPLSFSIIGKALKEKNWSLNLIDLKNFSKKGVNISMINHMEEDLV